MERERIARDLHDILDHTLSFIVLKAELTEKLLSHGQHTEAQKHLSELSQTARNYLSEAISKLNASNRIDAARIARQKGWL